MRKSALLAAATFSLALGTVALFAEPTTAPADKVALEAQYQSIPEPQIDDSQLSDTKYRDDAEQRVKAYNALRAKVARQILEVSPNDTNAEQYLDTIFSDYQGGGQLKDVVPFAKSLLSKTQDSTVKRECTFIIALVALHEPSLHAEAPAAVDAFLAGYSSDSRTPSLLGEAAQQLPDRAQTYIDRLKKDYGDAPETEMVLADVWRQTQVGKPFKLSFTDAISGDKVDIAQLKGKVVVVDFWATWCGPCVQAMPEIKKTYAQYKDKGVVFLGVSLDNPESEQGLTKLKKFVADNQIAWPQYYQGNGWDSEFSKSWKIMSIPTAFLVDAQGNLASTNAFGRLDTLLPKELAKQPAAKQLTAD